jgi:NAD(P)-dependent dehydrogenase (short-subunit alcohol dehydrogenase family)
MSSWGGKTWFITGASTGFGRAMAEAVLEQGGRVVATARDTSALAELIARSSGRAIAVSLDVTKTADVRDAVRRAEDFGGLDVLFNNAGYGFLGGIEESSDAEIARQFDTNFFGALQVTRAALPAMRRRGAGYIVNVSSIAGVRGFAGAGFYCASKFALEAMTEALADEIAPFGLRALIVEPGYFRTDFSGRSIATTRTPHPDYALLAAHRAQSVTVDGKQRGDPRRGVRAIIEAMDRPAPPLHLALGPDAAAFVASVAADRSKEVETWKSISDSTDFR